MLLRYTLFALSSVALIWAMPARAEAVDVELYLAVDVSGSMNGEELRLQRDGYVAALRSNDVLNAIAQGAYGKVAITYVEWARDDLYRIILPWTLVANRTQAEYFADRLATAPVNNLRNTSITGAIKRATAAFANNGFEGERLVIDISGDGPNNQGGLVTDARDAAISQGITINGLPLMIEAWRSELITPSLDAYYRACVTGGPGSFVFPVDDWAKFPTAVRQKLVLELSGRMPNVSHKIVPAQFTAKPDVDCLIGERLREMREREN